MKCPLCTTNLVNKLDEIYYDCSTCRALVKERGLYPRPQDEQKRYLEHNNDVKDSGYRKFTSPISNYILDHYEPQHKGLDFGSGTGPVISAVLQEQGYNIAQYDPYFAPDEELLERRYDYIVACEVVEHFYEPAKEFERLSRMLQPGGVLACMTHLYNGEVDFENWYYRKDPTHVFIYRAATFHYIRRKYGFGSCAIDGRRVLMKK